MIRLDQSIIKYSSLMHKLHYNHACVELLNRTINIKYPFSTIVRVQCKCTAVKCKLYAISYRALALVLKVIYTGYTIIVCVFLWILYRIWTIYERLNKLVIRYM